MPAKAVDARNRVNLPPPFATPPRPDTPMSPHRDPRYPSRIRPDADDIAHRGVTHEELSWPSAHC